MPQQLTIITNPDPRLRQMSDVVSLKMFKDKKFQIFLDDLEETMLKKDGAGLAAPQVGQNIRVIVISYDQEILFMINPRITRRSWAQVKDEEGCLSVVDSQGEILYGPVKRHKKINCTYFNRYGQIQKINVEKLTARIIQHEIDHLDGILFIDRLEKGAKLKKLSS